MSSNNLNYNSSITIDSQQETSCMTWKIKHFDTLRNELNKKNETFPYLDSPVFSVGAYGPGFVLRLYPNGDNKDSKKCFSLYLMLEYIGHDQRWKVKDNVCTKIPVKFELSLLYTKGEKWNKTSTYRSTA